jgi:hypothetical protein
MYTLSLIFLGTDLQPKTFFRLAWLEKKSLTFQATIFFSQLPQASIQTDP